MEIRRRNRMARLWGKKPPNPLLDINQAGYKQPSRGSWPILWLQSGSLGPFARSPWTRFFSGMIKTWSGNWKHLRKKREQRRPASRVFRVFRGSPLRNLLPHSFRITQSREGFFPWRPESAEKRVWTGPPFPGKLHSQRNVCQGNEKCVFRTILLTNISLTPLRFLPSSTLHPPSSLWLRLAAPPFPRFLAAPVHGGLPAVRIRLPHLHGSAVTRLPPVSRRKRLRRRARGSAAGIASLNLRMGAPCSGGL